jgi:hypothetical protein
MNKVSKLLLCFSLILVVLSFFIWVSCEKKQSPVTPTAPTETGSLQKMLPVTENMEAVMAIQNRYTDAMFQKVGVVGTATTRLNDGSYAVKILTRNAASAKNLPKFIENIPVVVEEVGELRALSFTNHYRPVTEGVSGGNINDRTRKGSSIYCSGGTIGCVVYKSGKNYFLSNNHVFARENKATIGEDIIQPGLIDVNCSQISGDAVADLSQFVTISMKRTANNKVDAAIAEIRSTTSFTPATQCGYTPSSTIATATVGLQVKKCGRTTEYTEGQVTGLNVTVLISYSGGTARFINQIQFNGMSDSGDSGSLIVTKADNKPVALLFAGSTSTTIGNPIQEVMNAFGINF